MIKLDPSPTSLTYPAPSDVEVQSVHRLIVIVPADLDIGAGTRRIWELAKTTGMCIQLLGLCKDAAEEPGLRRALVSMASLLQNGKTTVELKIESGTNWVKVIKRNAQPGDMIVCFAWQQAGLLHKPLSQILQSSLNIPVYIITDLRPPVKGNVSWVSQFFAWGGSVGLIVGFFLFQARVVLSPGDWVQTTLLILSVIAEVWLIGAWNSLFS